MSEAAQPAQPASAERALDLCAVAAVLCLGALTASTLASVRYAENPDEAYYVAYASHLAQHGLGGFRTFFHDYLTEPARWLYPNPLRIGFITLASAWTGLRGASFEALSQLSLLCHVLLLGSAYLWLRGLLGRAQALLAVALIGCSPLLAGIARRAWVDAAASLAGLLVLWSFMASLRQPERSGPRALFAVAFGCGILVKETTLLLALPCAALLAWERFGARQSAIPLAGHALALAAPLAVCAGLWWLAAGDLHTLLGVGRVILESPASNTYAQAYGGGPWSRYLVDLLLLAPWTTALGIAGLGLAARGVRERTRGDARVWLAIVVLGTLVAYAPFTKNVRYVALIEVPLRALATLLLWELANASRSRRGLAFAVALLLALCAVDWLGFQRIFVEAALYDPMTASLLVLRGLASQP
jgi:4-amino-4-deoxy-L-arabinose transferase-like glycosyltransferase